MLNSLRDAFNYANEKKIALGHFNVSTIEAINAIVTAAKSLDVPVVIGVSEGERDFLGIKVVASIIHTIRESQQYPVFLNADHTFSLDRVREVVEAGYDSVIFDGAALSREENTSRAKEAVAYVKSIRPEMLVEAEIGYIGKSSSLLDKLPENAAITEDQMPTSQEVADFINTTGVDLISPAVGNIHGMLKNAPNPEISVRRIGEIAAAISVPIILHGGSGISDQQFKDAINAGVRMVHINTEIRHAWKQALAVSLTQDENEVAPYKLLGPSQKAMGEVVYNRLKLFANL